MGDKFWYFSFLYQYFLKLIEVVFIKNLHNVFQLLFKKLAVGDSHLLGSSFEICNVKIVFLKILKRPNEEFLSVLDLAQ